MFIGLFLLVVFGIFFYFEKVVLCYTLIVFLSRSVFIPFFSSHMNTHLKLLHVGKGKGLFIENI